MQTFDTLDTQPNKELAYPRTLACLTAIEKSASFTFQETRFFMNNGHRLEVIVVKLECDGVPSQEPFGIRYEEEFALLFLEDERLIPCAIPTREDFPVVLHLNQATPDSILPTHLCLYAEHPSDVAANWTAERFLARIYWWIENASKGELHKEIQPLEEPFYNAKDEIVFPPMAWKEIHGVKTWYCSNVCNRGNDGVTLILSNKQESPEHEKRVSIITLDCPKTMQGNPELLPKNLNELAGYLGARFGEHFLRDRLVEYFRAVTPNTGLEDDSGELVVLLLTLPVCRSEDEDPEKTIVKAFLYPHSLRVLGERLGILAQSGNGDNNWYFTLIGNDYVTLDDTLLSSLQTYRWNKSKDFAFQSGTEHASGKIGLIGLGSLGSSIFEMWLRSGMDDWVLIDPDHIKPHNVTRHVLSMLYIGQYKANACEHYAKLINPSASFISIPKNAVYLDDQEQAHIQRCDLVIDASAGLEYPRSMIGNSELPRHASVFITPNGKNSVLMIEDLGREIKLDILEAQYYRAMLRSGWGENHLTENAETFVSGASCRDISLQMSYTDIVQSAAMISALLLEKKAEETASVVVFQGGKGIEIQCDNIPIAPATEYDIGGFVVIFDNELKQRLENERCDSLPAETGGVLIGYHDFSAGQRRIYVVDSISNPLGSQGTPSGYLRSGDTVPESLERIGLITRNRVGYLGEWHSHGQGISAKQSQIDKNQVVFMSQHLDEAGLPALQLIVSGDDIAFYTGEA